MIKELQNIIKDALDKLNISYDEIKIVKSNRPDLCDYQYDGAFKLAKLAHTNPVELGTKIVEIIKEKEENLIIFSAIECVKPGFINLTLSDEFINFELNKMITNEKFNIEMPEREKIVIDYGGPNVAKPLHIGHLRSAVVGESIKRILKYMNQEVISDVHLGDYGLQIGQVIYGLKQENISIEDITLDKLERIYPQISGLCKENEEIRAICGNITKELQENNEEYQAYFKKILEISKQDIKRLYDYLDVSFDLWYGESDSYKYIDALTEELNKSNLLALSEGAKVVHVSKADDKIEIPPLIYQTSIGSYLYGTTDLATIYEREQDFKPDSIYYVTDLRQQLHFTQVFRTCTKLPMTSHIKFEHLGFGTVNGTDGKPFKTRAGNAPKLDDLFNETKEIFIAKKEENKDLSDADLNKIVNSIIKFADLQNNREKDYIYDINKFSEVTGKTGPYIIYTNLRINKIVKDTIIGIDRLSKNIYNKQDRELRIKLLDLENTLKQAMITKLPSIIANYLYELCVLMNAFYENNHINNLEDENKKADWVNVLKLTNSISKLLLNLLVIELPDKM